MILAVKFYIRNIHMTVYTFSDYSMPVILTNEFLERDPLAELKLLREKDADIETGQVFWSLDDVVRWMDTRNLWNGGERAMMLRSWSDTGSCEGKIKFYQIKDDND